MLVSEFRLSPPLTGEQELPGWVKNNAASVVESVAVILGAALEASPSAAMPAAGAGPTGASTAV